MKQTQEEDPENRRAIERLYAEGCSCVVRNGGTMRSFHQRGVSDLWRLLHEEPELLRGAFVADKVVGKGAAALMAVGEVRRLYARTVSRPALELLAAAGIPVEYETVAEHIINRAGTGICPVEQLCADARTPEECLPRIGEFIRRMKEQTKTAEHETK
ncbi:DUF1893 domain-containing protein [Alistipes megaguti]|uniref:DUF1893 domain-containing protein n=1 Tax=Alistipes megaguti TaxID=2364787 RepID=UPI00235695CB|nr:DUF1893 domain-containing protein [Alistipes megaguti]